MPETVKTVQIIYRASHGGAAELAKAMASWLEERGISVLVAESGPSLAFRQVDCVIVLGGDGTILGVARKLAGAGIPLLGINYGHVGFLTAFDAREWRRGLEMALSGLAPLRHCLCLKWELLRSGAAIATGIVINDLVLSRGSLARLINAGVAVNGHSLGVLRCDGLIVASPLGSTGYNMSAGGPVLPGSMNAMVLTPVCPFMSNPAPLVFGADAILEIKPKLETADCFLTLDGQDGLELLKGDSIRVTCWPKAILLMGSDDNFYARLRKRALPCAN